MSDSFLSSMVILSGSYIIGSIPFAIIVTRVLKGTDVRAHGSGHAGATNTMRVVGWLPGVLVMILDLAKGAIVAWLVLSYSANPAINWLATALVVVGHCWPIFAGFRGGMGMATAGGALLVYWPLGFVLGIGLAAGMQLLIRHSARGNLATGIFLAPLWLVFGATTLQTGAALATGLVVGLRATADWNRVYHELWFDRKSDFPE